MHYRLWRHVAGRIGLPYRLWRRVAGCIGMHYRLWRRIAGRIGINYRLWRRIAGLIGLHHRLWRRVAGRIGLHYRLWRHVAGRIGLRYRQWCRIARCVGLHHRLWRRLYERIGCIIDCVSALPNASACHIVRLTGCRTLTAAIYMHRVLSKPRCAFGGVITRGSGASKKQAQQMAARSTWFGAHARKKALPVAEYPQRGGPCPYLHHILAIRFSRRPQHSGHRRPARSQ